jgi:hypothetical protein
MEEGRTETQPCPSTISLEWLENQNRNNELTEKMYARSEENLSFRIRK